MSARAHRSRSMSSMFSSSRVTECPGGVRAASRGRLASGMLARFPRNGSRMLQSPVRNLETRIDQDDLGHGSADLETRWWGLESSRRRPPRVRRGPAPSSRERGLRIRTIVTTLQGRTILQRRGPGQWCAASSSPRSGGLRGRCCGDPTVPKRDQAPHPPCVMPSPRGRRWPSGRMRVGAHAGLGSPEIHRLSPALRAPSPRGEKASVNGHMIGPVTHANPFSAIRCMISPKVSISSSVA